MLTQEQALDALRTVTDPVFGGRDIVSLGFVQELKTADGRVAFDLQTARGVADGLEDLNGNGAIDPGETDPRDPDTVVGPLISPEAARRVEAWIDEALAQGARRLAGGPRQGAVVWRPPHDGSGNASRYCR